MAGKEGETSIKDELANIILVANTYEARATSIIEEERILRDRITSLQSRLYSLDSIKDDTYFEAVIALVPEANELVQEYGILLKSPVGELDEETINSTITTPKDFKISDDEELQRLASEIDLHRNALLAQLHTILNNFDYIQLDLKTIEVSVCRGRMLNRVRRKGDLDDPTLGKDMFEVVPSHLVGYKS